MSGNLFQFAEVEWLGGLFDKEQIKSLKPAAQTDGLIGGQTATQVNHYIDGRSDSISDSPYFLDCEVRKRPINGAPRHVSDTAGSRSVSPRDNT